MKLHLVLAFLVLLVGVQCAEEKVKIEEDVMEVTPDMKKRFWGMYGLGYGFGYPYYGLWGKRDADFDEDDKVDIETKKRFWGMYGLGYGFGYPYYGLWGKRDTETVTTAMDKDLIDMTPEKKIVKRAAVDIKATETKVDEIKMRADMNKRFWGMYGYGLGYGFGYPYYGLWGKRDTETVTTAMDEDLIDMTPEKKIVKRAAVDTKATETKVDEIKMTADMNKRFWGMYGLGYGFGYPYYGLWGKRSDTKVDNTNKFTTTDTIKKYMKQKRDNFNNNNAGYGYGSNFNNNNAGFGYGDNFNNNNG